MDTLFSNYDFRIFAVDRTELDSSWDSDLFRPAIRYTHCTRLYLPLEGEGTLTYQGKILRLKPGKMYLIFPAALVRIKCETRLVKYWIHFNLLNSSTNIDFFAFQREILEIPVTKDKLSLYCGYFETLRKFYKGRSSVKRSVIDELEAKSILSLLLVPFLHHLSYPQEENDFFKIIELCQYMSQNISKHITVVELGKRIHLHPNYLSNLFHRHTGLSPIAYLDSLRMQYAMEELCHGKLRISEIAEKAGSNSLQAFSRKFTKFLGISPRDYRKKMKNGTTEFYRLKD